MRRLALVLCLALAVIVPAAALAGGSEAGDGSFELRAVNGTVTLVGRGVLWGQIDKGTIRVTDVSAADGAVPLVAGAEHTRIDADGALYRGTNLHFRITGGRYRLKFVGSGLDLTAIGIGSADLLGDLTAVSPGTYALDGGKWMELPLIDDKTVLFGVQPSTTPTTPVTTTTGP